MYIHAHCVFLHQGKSWRFRLPACFGLSPPCKSGEVLLQNGKRVKVKPFTALLLLSAVLQKETHPELVLFKTSLVCVFQNLDEMASEVCLLVFALQW